MIKHNINWTPEETSDVGLSVLEFVYPLEHFFSDDELRLAPPLPPLICVPSKSLTDSAKIRKYYLDSTKWNYYTSQEASDGSGKSRPVANPIVGDFFEQIAQSMLLERAEKLRDLALNEVTEHAMLKLNVCGGDDEDFRSLVYSSVETLCSSEYAVLDAETNITDLWFMENAWQVDLLYRQFDNEVKLTDEEIAARKKENFLTGSAFDLQREYAARLRAEGRIPEGHFASLGFQAPVRLYNWALTGITRNIVRRVTHHEQLAARDMFRYLDGDTTWLAFPPNLVLQRILTNQPLDPALLEAIAQNQPMYWFLQSMLQFCKKLAASKADPAALQLLFAMKYNSSKQQFFGDKSRKSKKGSDEAETSDEELVEHLPAEVPDEIQSYYQG